MFRKMCWLLIDIPSALYNNYVLFLLDAEDLEPVENGIPAIRLSKTFLYSNQKDYKNAPMIFSPEKNSTDFISSIDNVFVKLEKIYLKSWHSFATLTDAVEQI